MIRTVPQLRLFLHQGRVFERFHLKEIGVFGSFARNESFNDLDLLVSHPQKSSLSHLLRLREWLEEALPYPVDIVVEEFANPILLHRAKKDLKMLRASENDLLHLLDMLQRIAKVTHSERHVYYPPKLQTHLEALIREELTKGTFHREEFEVAKDSEFYAEVDFSRIEGQWL